MILLVEDNKQDELLTIRALEKNNIMNRVDVVRDGQEALDYIFRRGPFESISAEAMPQVILLDLKLPKIDGIEVLRQLRADERTKRVPVVVLTTSNEDIDLLRAYDLGANSYVRKPVDFNEFMGAVKNLGLYWLVLNECPTAP